jgi:hypothetical protein
MILQRNEFSLVIKHHTIKMFGKLDFQLDIFLTRSYRVQHGNLRVSKFV